MPGSHISAAMLDAVGRTYGAMTSFPVSPSDIRRWAVAIYYPEVPPRLYWDEDYARRSVHGGIVAPEEFNPFAWMRAEPAGPAQSGPVHDSDDTERHVGVPGPGLAHMLNGGADVTYGVRMRPGDVIRSESQLSGYHERQGRLGLMLFTIMTNTWTNQRQELVKTQRTTLIRY